MIKSPITINRATSILLLPAPETSKLPSTVKSNSPLILAVCIEVASNDVSCVNSKFSPEKFRLGLAIDSNGTTT